MQSNVHPINKTMADIAKAFAPTRWQKIKVIFLRFYIKAWAKLGFGICAFPTMVITESEKGCNKFARDYLGTDVRVKLRLYERLQLIISGRLVIRQSMATWPMVKRSMSKTAISILPPGIE